MRHAIVATGAVVGVLVAYAIEGALAAFIAAATLFVLIALWLCARIPAPPKNVERVDDAERRDPRQHLVAVTRIEMQLNRALRSRRIYDHALKPWLFRIAIVLLAQNRTARQANADAVRELVGERLWPLIDPSVKSFDEVPQVPLREVGELVSRLESLV